VPGAQQLRMGVRPTRQKSCSSVKCRTAFLEQNAVLFQL
jgi:hypothetical protein